MLEKLADPKNATISRANIKTLTHVKNCLEASLDLSAFRIAELGIGVGATSLALAELLNNRGELHLYDFEGRATELADDLQKRGFNNISAFENTSKHWDSYHWNLAKQCLTHSDYYDYIYIDGAHTLLHDTTAFFLSDKLIKIGGIMDFDDYDWKYSQSGYLKNTRDQLMTEEQIETPQVKMIVDLFLSCNTNYETVLEKKIFRKVSSNYRSV